MKTLKLLLDVLDYAVEVVKSAAVFVAGAVVIAAAGYVADRLGVPIPSPAWVALAVLAVALGPYKLVIQEQAARAAAEQSRTEARLEAAMARQAQQDAEADRDVKSAELEQAQRRLDEVLAQPRTLIANVNVLAGGILILPEPPEEKPPAMRPPDA